MLISLSILSVSQRHLKINQVLIMKKKNHNMFNNEIDFSLKVGRKKRRKLQENGEREKKKKQPLTPESRTWNFSIMLHSLCSLYNAVLIRECHQCKTLNHDSVTIFSLKIYEELCLFKDSPKKIFLNTSFKGC